ncbi:MAG: hypothetical protein ACFFDN_02405 [Candidatus Hodarchaeota archaeon]
MKVNKNILLEAMKKCLPGVEKGNSIIEGADTFVFSEKKVQSYNDYISITVPFDLDLEGSVKSIDFFKLVSKLKEDDFDIEVNDNKWNIKNGTSKISINLLDNEINNYIKVLNIEKLEWLDLDDSFFEGLKLCIIQNNPFPHSGIFVNRKIIISTDSMRVNFFDLNKKMRPFLIDDYVAKELLKFESIKQYSVADGWVYFKSEEIIFSCRCKDHSSYPFEHLFSQREVFLKAENDICNSISDQLIEAVDRVSVLSKELMDTRAVELTFEKDKIILFAKRESGEITETIPLKNPFNKDISIWVDVYFLLEAIKKVSDFYIKESEFKTQSGKKVTSYGFVFYKENYQQLVAIIE